MSLNKTLEKSFNSKVSGAINFDFEIKNEGFYLVKIVARAGAWWQQLPIFEGKYWLDEELKASLDEKPIEPYFNGNSLFGTRQFIILFERFSPGSHSLNFKSKGKPLLEAVEVSELNEDGEPFDLISLIGNKPEDTLLSSFVSRKKNWVTIVSLSQPLLYLLINAQAKGGQQLLFWQTDDEDLQLKLNVEVQKNNEPKSHPFWYWCGRVSKGVGKIYEGSFTDQDSIHRIDILADRSPEINQVLVSFGRVPTVSDPLWTGSFDGDSDVMLLARLIFGEAENQSREAKVWIGGSVFNRVKAIAWPNTIREVILQSGQYDPFKKTDPNFSKIIDPTNKAGEKRIAAWNESYEVAFGLISGGIFNLTEATHFHGKGVTRSWFLDKVVPQGRYIKTIDDTSFYWSPN